MTTPTPADLDDLSSALDALTERGYGVEELAIKDAISEIKRLRAAADEVDRLRAELMQAQQDVTDAENDGIGWMDRANRLRAAIENAPHGRACHWMYATSHPCTCWKADAL